MSTPRTPDEILAVLDGAQRDLDEHSCCVAPGDYNLRDLLWEVLEDVLSTAKLAAIYPHPETPIHSRPLEVYTSVEQYLVNHYGDD